MDADEDGPPEEQPNAPPTLDAIVAENPHCAQLHAEVAQPFVEAASLRRTLADGDRYMSEAWPRMRYQQRGDADRSSCHWGQLKLFECELRFLTDLVSGCGGAVGSTAPVPTPAPEAAAVAGDGSAGAAASTAGVSPLVVYVGAAPGRHIPSLARRFPSCRFELYDPADFDERLVAFAASEEAAGRVRVRQSFFDEAAAEELGKRLAEGGCRPLVFMSDIRTADEKLQDVGEVQAAVAEDMARQRRWVEALQPDLSVLKFRLPWGPGKSRYLPGRIFVQAFPPCTSTETRLVLQRSDLARQPAEVEYDQEEYEERLMYHNTVTRARLHELGLDPAGIEGLDRCFDCAALADTVRRYLAAAHRVRPEAVDSQELAAELAAMLTEIGEHSGRTLATPYHVSSSRHAGQHFARRKYKDDEGRDCLIMVSSKQARKRRRKAQQASKTAQDTAEAT